MPLPKPLTNQPFHWRHDNARHVCLMLHGLGGGVYEMESLAWQLHEHGYAVAAINYPGHATTARWMPDSAWEEWYEHAEETLKTLQGEYETISLIAFSTGCPLAAKLALSYPTAHLVFLSPFFKIASPWFCPVAPEKLMNWLSPSLLPKIEHPLFSSPLMEKLEASAWVQQHVHKLMSPLAHAPRMGYPLFDRSVYPHLKAIPRQWSFNLRAVHSALALIEDITPRLSELETPLLVIQSRYDSVVCPSGAQLVHDQAGSAHKKLVWLERSNHVITLDYDRQHVYEQVLAFLNDQLLQQVLQEEDTRILLPD